MQKENNKGRNRMLISICLSVVILATGIIFGYLWYFEKTYRNRAYPNLSIDSISFGGKSYQEIESYWIERSQPIATMQFEFRFDTQTATFSGSELGLSYDATLSATQALSVGRSEHLFSNIRERYLKQPLDLPASIRWDTDGLNQLIATLADTINIPVENALFRFSNGKVSAFRPSKNGRAVNEEEIRKRFASAVRDAVKNKAEHVIILVPVDPIEPLITTTQANSFGIKELIGRGYSEFPGSIAGRIHNIALAASRLNGILIPPGKTFSFNETVGDISAATGYQSAYIIKDGKTVLGDGGGVCQVSTTLFRAALNAGLPIVERREHSYRVHYYEDDGSKAGLDATVFNPTEDLKFTNDTPAYILIQTKIDTANVNLAFEFYGATDGRKAEVLNHVVGSITPPPPPLYQDDPTLPVGVVKQVDFAAWGAKASFDYRVTKNGQVIFEKTFVSNFRPWQAVYLKGTKE